MPIDPQLLPACMAGIVGALLLFAGLLQFGTRLIRWLALPQDLPEGPRFEPPPPPSVPGGDRTVAKATAAAQARLCQLYAQAHAVVRAAAQCQELHLQVSAAGPVAPFVEVATVTERCSATAVASATALEQTLAAFDRRLRSARTQVGEGDLQAFDRDIAAQALVTQGALAQARAAVAPLPAPSDRRLLLLVGVLVVMIAWVVVMHYLLKK